MSGFSERSRPQLKRTTHLHFRPQDDMSIPFICQTKDPTKLVHRELANIPNLQFGRLGTLSI